MLHFTAEAYRSRSQCVLRHGIGVVGHNLCVSVCVRVRKIEREGENVYVSVCVRERVGGRERERDL